jgi:hypothetical protein
VSGQIHVPAALLPGNGERAPGTHWIGGWVDPRAGMDDVERRKFLTLPGLELRPIGLPARNQSLYRLRYPGSSAAWYISNTTVVNTVRVAPDITRFETVVVLVPSELTQRF